MGENSNFIMIITLRAITFHRYEFPLLPLDIPSGDWIFNLEFEMIYIFFANITISSGMSLLSGKETFRAKFAFGPHIEKITIFYTIKTCYTRYYLPCV